MKKKNYGTVLISILLVGAVVGWMTFNSSQEPHPAVEYRAVCRGLPTNAHWTDGSTRKEIPQTESSPNVRTPSPIGTYATGGEAGEGCRFTCIAGYEYDEGTSTCISSLPRGTITITGDTTTYVLADRNVGATEVYDGTNCTSESCPQSVAGYVFQRGNNHGFTGTIADGNTAVQAGITTGSSQIAWRAFYSTWITTNPRYNNGNGTFLRGNSDSTQGPCSTGRHVPTTTERQAIFSALGTSQSGFSITNTLKLPPAGFRHYSSVSASNVGTSGRYRPSTPHSSTAHIYYLGFDSSNVTPKSSTFRSYGFSVRCLQDS